MVRTGFVFVMPILFAPHTHAASFGVKCGHLDHSRFDVIKCSDDAVVFLRLGD